MRPADWRPKNWCVSTIGFFIFSRWLPTAGALYMIQNQSRQLWPIFGCKDEDDASNYMMVNTGPGPLRRDGSVCIQAYQSLVSAESNVRGRRTGMGTWADSARSKNQTNSWSWVPIGGVKSEGLAVGPHTRTQLVKQAWHTGRRKKTPFMNTKNPLQKRRKTTMEEELHTKNTMGSIMRKDNGPQVGLRSNITSQSYRHEIRNCYQQHHQGS